MMSNNITSLEPSALLQYANGNTNLYVNGDFALLRSLKSVLNTPIVDMMRSLQYVELGRVVLIKNGRAQFKINLISYELNKNNVLLISEHNYIQIPEVSEDFDGEIISFHHTPILTDDCIHLNLNDNDFSRLCQYSRLLWDVAQSSGNIDILASLQSALLIDINTLYKKETKGSVKNLTRSEEIFKRFLEMHRKADLPRNVKAYAEYLCISPNHLSAIVKKESGRSVMNWLNDYCILKAKVMLTNTNLPIYLIGEKLGFPSATLFTRFFIKQTGCKPSDFRANRDSK